MWPATQPFLAAFRSGWRPWLVLTILGWIELGAIASLGLRPEGVLTAIAGPISALSHDLTVSLALPLPLIAVLALLTVGAAVRVWAYQQLTGWSVRRWITTWLIGLIAVIPVATILLAFGLTGVPYLWLAGAVFALALTVAMVKVFGQRSWQWALLAPVLTTLIGGLARMAGLPVATAIVALGIPVVTGASILSFDQEPTPANPVRVVSIIAIALGVVMAVSGVLYVLLQPSPQAPPAIQRQLEAAQASTDPTRVILVDGFNTSRSTLPWLGTTHPTTWFSYAGRDRQGNPLPYKARDTLSGVLANVDALAAQIEHESVKGQVTLVGISQGTWIIEGAIHRYPHLRDHLDQVILIDTPISKDWIDIFAPTTHAGLELISGLVRAVTPVTIDSQGPLAQELTNDTLPSLATTTGVPTVWLRSVSDAATVPPPLSTDTTVVTYWGAHALTIGLPTGRNTVARIIDGDLQSQWGSEWCSTLISALAAPWQLPGRY